MRGNFRCQQTHTCALTSHGGWLGKGAWPQRPHSQSRGTKLRPDQCGVEKMSQMGGPCCVTSHHATVSSQWQLDNVLLVEEEENLCQMSPELALVVELVAFSQCRTATKQTPASQLQSHHDFCISGERLLRFVRVTKTYTLAFSYSGRLYPSQPKMIVEFALTKENFLFYQLTVIFKTSKFFLHLTSTSYILAKSYIMMFNIRQTGGPMLISIIVLISKAKKISVPIICRQRQGTLRPSQVSHPSHG